MTDHVLVPFHGETLALTVTEFQQAIERGRALIPQTTTANPDAEDRIVDCAEAARLTSVPQSWFEQAIREGRIPCLTFGKYKRLRLSDLLKACEIRAGHRDTASPGHRLKLAGKGQK